MNSGLHRSYDYPLRSSGRPSARRSEQDLRANAAYDSRTMPPSLAVGQVQVLREAHRGAPWADQSGHSFAQRMRTTQAQDSTLDMTGGIPRSFSTTAQIRVAAMHQRRRIQEAQGHRLGLAPVVEAAEDVEGGQRARSPAPRLPLLAFSGSGHLPMQENSDAIIARKNQLVRELYALESRGSMMNGIGLPRERELVAELMDLVHEHQEAEDLVTGPVELPHEYEKAEELMTGPVELPAVDDASPGPAYARRPVWQQPDQELTDDFPESYASEPWAERPRQGLPAIRLEILPAPEDQVYDVEGQSSRSFPANLSEFQVETLLRESMYEARRRQVELAEQTASHQANQAGPSTSTSNTTIPSIYMIQAEEGESDDRMIDPRYNPDLNETYLIPGGKMNARQRRRLAGICPQIHDAPEVVTAEMYDDAPPEIVMPPEERQAQLPLRYQHPPVEPDEAPLVRQASRQGLSARNSLKKTWKSFWNLR